MNDTERLFSALAIGFLLAPPSHSATQDLTPATAARGMLSAWPAGLLYKTSAGVQPGLRLKKTGNQMQAPAPIPALPQGPNYAAISSMPFADAIDAHSTGNGAFPALTEGKIVLDDSWLALTVSVNDGVTGTSNSLFEQAETAGRSTGSEIVSYYFQTDGALPVGLTGLTGTAVVETDPTDLGFPSMGGEDVHALDYGIGAMHLVGGSTDLFTAQIGYFFSLTEEWATTNDGLAFARRTELAPNLTVEPDAGAIYYMIPNGDSWSEPILYRSSVELGLMAGGDIDGFEVNWAIGAVIYSATIGSDYDANKIDGAATQIMYHQRGSKPTAARAEDGETITRKVRVSDNPTEHEIDAVCGIDPESSTYFRRVGIPAYEAVTVGQPLGFSVARYPLEFGATHDELVFQITGWGDLAVTPCRAQIFRSDSTSLVSGQINVNDQSVWTHLRTRVRRPAQTTTEFSFLTEAPLSSSDTPTTYCLVLRGPGSNPTDGAILAHSFVGKIIF